MYVAKTGSGPWQLYVRRLDQLEGRALNGTENGVMPFFSPDGRWIGFSARMPAKLMKVSIDGGPPVPLADVAFQGAADWGPDGEIVYGNMTPDGRHGLFRVSANGGSPRLVAVLDRSAGEWLTPQSLFESQAILCTVVAPSPRGPHFQIVAVSTTTGEKHVVLDDAKHGLYVGHGILVYQRQGSLFATRIDTKRLTVSGPPVGVWDGVHPTRMHGRSWAHAGGMLVYAPGLRSGYRLVWVDRTGKVERLPAPPDFYFGPRLAPDGQSVAVVIGGAFGNVWRYDLARNALVQLTFDGRCTALIWTSDSSHLTVSTIRDAGGEILQIRADGSAQPDLLMTSPVAKWPSSWARDGRMLAFVQHAVASDREIWGLTLDASREAKPIVRDAGSQWGARVSPDGRWMAYTSNESGRDEVYVTAFPTARPKWRVSTDGGHEPVWARSGRELFYRSGDRMMSVPVTAGSTFTPGVPTRLFSGRFYFTRPGDPNYDVSLDDQRFLMVLPGNTEGADRLNVIQGWTKRVEQRLRDGT